MANTESYVKGITIKLDIIFDEKYLKGTSSIKMCEINPTYVKETSFTCSLVIN